MKDSTKWKSLALFVWALCSGACFLSAPNLSAAFLSFLAFTLGAAVIGVLSFNAGKDVIREEGSLEAAQREQTTSGETT